MFGVAGNLVKFVYLIIFCCYFSVNTCQGELPNPTFHPSVPVEEWEDEDDAQDFQEHNNRPHHNNYENNHHRIRAV